MKSRTAGAVVTIALSLILSGDFTVIAAEKGDAARTFWPTVGMSARPAEWDPSRVKERVGLGETEVLTFRLHARDLIESASLVLSRGLRRFVSLQTINLGTLQPGETRDIEVILHADELAVIGDYGGSLRLVSGRRTVQAVLPIIIEVVEGSGDGDIPLKDDTVADLPVIFVDPPQPAGGTTATVTVKDPAALSISLQANGQGCGEFSSHAVAGSELVVSRIVGEFGVCNLAADVVASGSTHVAETTFSVEPVALDLPAVRVTDGFFVPGMLPDAAGDLAAVTIESIDAPGTLINGGVAQLRINLLNPENLDNITQVQIATQGAGGAAGFYKVVPTFNNGAIVLDVLLVDIPSSTTATTTFSEGTQSVSISSILSLFLQILDQFGNISEIFTINFSTEEVGAGTVQVSLSWDTLTDVDLHVVEPTGEEIYWANPTALSLGQLDIDSNPDCFIDGINNENVTWPEGVVPPEGEYIVRVDFWQDCSLTGANFVVTTTICGKIETFNGSFAAGSDDMGGAGSGVEVTRFNFTSCAFLVSGTAFYEDRAQTTSGLASTTTRLPIRFAKVEVVRESDDGVLAEGETDQSGAFDIEFENFEEPGYRVVVIASQDNNVVKQDVEDGSGNIYAVTSALIDEMVEPEKVDLEIVAQATDVGPAFNIFDMGVYGSAFIRGVHGQTPSAVTWEWTQGQNGSCSSAVSCYFPSQDLISVLSVSSDPDEYDDLVLLHEYGHFWQNKFSRADSPGGSHSSRQRVDPLLAWGEGSATFFGNRTKDTSLYLDTTSAGVGVRLDIESLATNIPLGTSNGTQTGNISEAVVAAVLWDMTDTTNEAKDTLTSLSSSHTAVFSALSYLGSSAFSDRGVAGADLVDFLDGWFCKGNGNEGDANSGVRGNVIGLHNFNYDFASVASCL